MKLNLYHSKLADTFRQRNNLMLIAMLLLVTVSLQAFVIFYLSGRERVILVPPQLEQSVWIEGNKVSRSYLEQMTLFFSSLALNITPDNAGFKHQRLLQFIDPSVYGALKAKLAQEADVLKRRNLSTVFQPISLAINEDQAMVDIEGDFVTLIGQTETSSIRRTYRTQFLNRQGQWFVSEFKELNNEQK